MSVVWIFRNPQWSRKLVAVELVVQCCKASWKTCVQRRQDTKCSVVFWFRRIFFCLYNTLTITFFQELGVVEPCLVITFMTSRINSVVSSSVSLRSLALIPLEPTDFIFDLVNSDFGRLFCFFILGISIFSLFNRIALILKSSVGVLVVFFFHRSCLSTELHKTLQMCLRYLSSMLWCLRLHFSCAW